MTPSWGIEPGTHWWEVSALTTAPSLTPPPPPPKNQQQTQPTYTADSDYSFSDGVIAQYILTLSSFAAAFLSISGAFTAAEGTTAGGLSADEGDGWDCAEADGTANAGFEGSIGSEAAISLNVKFSTAACN